MKNARTIGLFGALACTIAMFAGCATDEAATATCADGATCSEATTCSGEAKTACCAEKADKACCSEKKAAQQN